LIEGIAVVGGDAREKMRSAIVVESYFYRSVLVEIAAETITAQGSARLKLHGRWSMEFAVRPVKFGM
jgi:hypothetical protein